MQRGTLALSARTPQPTEHASLSVPLTGCPPVCHCCCTPPGHPTCGSPGPAPDGVALGVCGAAQPQLAGRRALAPAVGGGDEQQASLAQQATRAGHAACTAGGGAGRHVPSAHRSARTRGSCPACTAAGWCCRTDRPACAAQPAPSPSGALGLGMRSSTPLSSTASNGPRSGCCSVTTGCRRGGQAAHARPGELAGRPLGPRIAGGA